MSLLEEGCPSQRNSIVPLHGILSRTSRKSFVRQRDRKGPQTSATVLLVLRRCPRLSLVGLQAPRHGRAHGHDQLCPRWTRLLFPDEPASSISMNGFEYSSLSMISLTVLLGTSMYLTVPLLFLYIEARHVGCHVLPDELQERGFQHLSVLATK